MISSDLSSEIQAALKSKDSTRVSVLRLLSAALCNAEVEKRGDLSEEETLGVITRELRKREEAAAEYQRGGRSDRAAAEEGEAAVLREWLPEPLSDDEISRLVDEAITETGATVPQQMGQVMKAVMPKLQGRADGKAVAELVRNRLTA